MWVVGLSSGAQPAGGTLIFLTAEEDASKYRVQLNVGDRKENRKHHICISNSRPLVTIYVILVRLKGK